MSWKPRHPDDFPSLGWGVLEWWADHLPSPRDPAAEFILTDSQAREVLEWFRIDPATGRYIYRRGYSRRSKGRGKSPIEAAKAIAEFAGPVRFAGWDANGQPVGRAWGREGDPLPLVQVCAVSEDQTANTWGALFYFLTDTNDDKRTCAADLLGIDAGLTRCFLRNRPGAKLEYVTASAGSREGAPLTYAVLDETHLWTPRNGGVKLAKTQRNNAAKMNARTFETTNAFVPGEGSVAEASYRAVEKGTPGIYADDVEAPRVIDGVAVDENAPDPVIRKALEVAYGSDTWWIDLDRQVLEKHDPDTKWEDFCRFKLNWNVRGGGSAVDAKQWGKLAQPREVADGERIGVGFDGSISDDTTGLIGCTKDGYLWVLEAWERARFEDGKPDKNWRVPRLEVGAEVRDTFDRFDVGRMLGDPPKWATELDSWADEFRIEGATVEERERVLVFDTNQRARFCKAVDRFLTAVREGSITHSGDDRLTAHVLAATLEKVRTTADEADQRTMYVIVKPEDGRKIDLAVAAVLAYEAAMTMPPEKPSPDLWVAYA